MNNATQTCGQLTSKRNQSLVSTLFSIVGAWRKNHRTRRHLAELPEHLWDDIGLDHRQIQNETQKPFWRD